MKQAPFLKPGALIRTVAPSCGEAEDPYRTRYLVSIKNLKRWGYRIEQGPNVLRNDGIIASAPAKDRGEEFMDAYSSDADLILSVAGGEFMDEMLPYVDFEKIKTLPPKWFMGFSDNTNLTFTLTTICDLITIYGPCAANFYEKPIRLSRLDALEMLHGKRVFEGYPKWHKPNFKKKPDPTKKVNPVARERYMTPKVITPHNYKKPFEGTMLGGCLDCLVNLCGTRFDHVKEFIEKHPEGIVWYLEACDLSVLSIRRALFQLKESGWFKNAKGFLIGRPLCWDQKIGNVDRFNAVIDQLEDLNVPILLDVDLGHYSPSMPMLNGEKATVSLIDGNIRIEYR